jgi:tartrate dehydrogenase/decarboxylase/D-malate dehydrogenase
MMLDFLGNGQDNYRAAHDAILRAIEAVLTQGPRTPDLKGSATATDVGKAIVTAIG